LGQSREKTRDNMSECGIRGGGSTQKRGKRQEHRGGRREKKRGESLTQSSTGRGVQGQYRGKVGARGGKEAKKEGHF